MTATRWLNVLGYSFQQHHKGIYYDGHEREDVVQYWKEFLEKDRNYKPEPVMALPNLVWVNESFFFTLTYIYIYNI